MDEHTVTVRAHVVLPKALLEEFDKVVGERHRSERVAALMEEWLRRERAKEVFTRLAGFVKDEDHPEWDTSEGIRNWLREVRGERDAWADIRPVVPTSEGADGAGDGTLSS